MTTGFCRQQDLFRSGQAGYHTLRIPALVVTGNGTLLAFAEGRKHGPGDAGEIDLVLRRSFDHGVVYHKLCKSSHGSLAKTEFTHNLGYHRSRRDMDAAASRGDGRGHDVRQSLPGARP